MDDLERFEIINRLHYRDTGHMAPDNYLRFNNWIALRLTSCALEAIYERDLILGSILAIADLTEELNMLNYTKAQVAELNSAMINISLILGK